MLVYYAVNCMQIYLFSQNAYFQCLMKETVDCLGFTVMYIQGF